MADLVSVASTAVPLVGTIPDKLTEAVMGAVIGGKSISDNLLDVALNGVYVKAENARNYAEEEYVFGLPQGAISRRTEPVIEDIVRITLVGEVGSAVSILYNVYSDADASLLCREYLQFTRGWDLFTNTFSNPGFTDLQFDSAIFKNTNNTIEIRYTFITTGLPSHAEDITVPGILQQEEYYHVGYYLLDDAGLVTGVPQYWYYAPSTGTNSLFSGIPEQSTSPYYPIIPLRKNNQDLADETLWATQQFITTDKLLHKLGVDFVELATAINENPDIAEIDHAYLMFGIDLHTEKETGIKYLWEYFNYLEPLVPYNENNYVYSNPNKVAIEDADLRQEIRFHYITRTTVVGSIGAVGTVIRESFPDEPDLLHVIETTYETDSGTQPYVYTVPEDMRYILLKKQVSPTEYEVLKIKGLVHVNYVYGVYTVNTNIKLSSDPLDANFLVPLHKGVLDTFTILDKNDLLYEGIVLLFQSFQRSSQAWYTSGLFKFVLTVIGIFLIIISAGATSGPVYAALAGLGLTGAALAIAMVIVNIAIGQLISAALSIIIRELGIENAAILAAVLVVAAAVSAAAGGGTSFNMPTAELLLLAAGAVMSGTQMAIAYEMEGLMSEYQDFATSSALQTEELEQAQSLLETSNTLDPLDLFGRIAPQFAYEAPTDLYNRTIHAGNIGALSLDIIPSYVDTALKLPRDIKSTLF